MRIWNPNMAEIARTWTRLAPETLRERKMRNGSSGLAAIACRATNPASRAPATAAQPIVCAEPQP